ncbi:dihydrofolate reductase [Bacillus infantis]|uniref:dihydrofolate reductase n=1 Tax=Bacillus infantis TaxID=324767 RepID=UPI003CF64D99
MTITLIACIDRNRGIGSNGNLLTKPPKDLKRFRELTLGGFVVFGKNTFLEIGKPLSGRVNILLTSDTQTQYHPELNVYQSVEDILHDYKVHADSDVNLFICGGQKVYEAFLPHADVIELTIVDHIFPEADRHFPQFSLSDFKPVETIHNWATEDYPYDYSFIRYERRK